MDRSNHYENAFEAYLRERRICYIAVDETRRAVTVEASVKNLDFIVYGPRGARLVIDVKGRRFPRGPKDKPRRVWANWALEADIIGLERWTERFGPGYRGLIVFAYHIASEEDFDENVPDLFYWRDRRYLFRAVDARDYRKHLRPHSPGWKTVALPAARFREIVHPVRHFTEGPAFIPDECPF